MGYPKKNGDIPRGRLDFSFSFAAPICLMSKKAMTDQQLALHAISEAQLLLEEYLQARPQNNQRILDKLVEVLERPDLIVAVSRLQQRHSL